ncbi:hypothetical protein [Streptomyces sp. NPDC006463]|uniref:hypothetical protein n=1 Tax=Streptomyces sp. NPDC006463 TaxID=3364746 RepID=UPI003692B071
MLPSISLTQEMGLAVLLVAALVWLVGLGHMLRASRSRHPEPGAFEGLAVIPAQRGAAAHPMEAVELTEAEKEAFDGLVRRIPLS